MLGLDVAFVGEIIRKMEYHSVPGVGRKVVGIASLRGRIVTIFDLFEVFDLPKGNSRGKDICIILKPGINYQDIVGFFVDRVEDIIEIDDNMIERAAKKDNIWAVKKIVKLAKGVIPLIDTEDIIDFLAKNTD